MKVDMARFASNMGMTYGEGLTQPCKLAQACRLKGNQPQKNSQDGLFHPQLRKLVWFSAQGVINKSSNSGLWGGVVSEDRSSFGIVRLKL